MKEWGLLFSAPMAKAVVEGRKTQTRRLDERLALAQPGQVLWGKEPWRTAKDLDSLGPVAIGAKAIDAGYPKPWAPIEYVADGARNGNWGGWPTQEAGKTRVSIHMCRWMSRIVTPIVSVRIEPLQAITEEDAIAEGVTQGAGGAWLGFFDEVSQRWTIHGTARDAFRDLWWSIHGNDERKRWEANPNVVRVQFEPLKPVRSEAAR